MLLLPSAKNSAHLISFSENLADNQSCQAEPSPLYHTAGSDTIFIQIYMDAPPGVPGMSKELEGHKD